MSYDSEKSGSSSAQATKYKGVRRRKWGKWVSEIRVPGTQTRLWLGSYATAEAAAVAHDVAFYCLRRPSTLETLNFPLMLPVAGLEADMPPMSVQKAASDAGMAVDARVQLSSAESSPGTERKVSGVQSGEFSSLDHQALFLGDVGENCGTWEEGEVGRNGEALSISIEDYL
ncbi:AP2/ERF domain containing protein [Parasponia andersonii]|uniref:AP2/ERF domain containing protein n=1 Tax=Parasponia andersonii TaxID=3476 RepID=A0A2P5DML1_PARAD|nr:AP2/ERF domain containing protein [Parasponia andersonii]